MVTDLIVKAKQVEYLINSLPEPEAEEGQASAFFLRTECVSFWSTYPSFRRNDSKTLKTRCKLQTLNTWELWAERVSFFSSPKRIF